MTGKRAAPEHPASEVLASLRRPQQERGERRVSAILDAAAELIVELGPAGLTVQALAERARTSKGSLYHFFPDLASVLCALADRHAEAIGALTRAMAEDPETEWRGLTVEETVERFLAPLAYLERHPDLLALARTPIMVDERTRRLAPLCELADHILRQRYPAMADRERRLRASTMVAVLDGVVGYAVRSPDCAAGEMMGELRTVLVAYLRTAEAGATATATATALQR